MKTACSHFPTNSWMLPSFVSQGWLIRNANPAPTGSAELRSGNDLSGWILCFLDISTGTCNTCRQGKSLIGQPLDHSTYAPRFYSRAQNLKWLEHVYLTISIPTQLWFCTITHKWYAIVSWYEHPIPLAHELVKKKKKLSQIWLKQILLDLSSNVLLNLFFVTEAALMSVRGVWCISCVPWEGPWKEHWQEHGAGQVWSTWRAACWLGAASQPATRGHRGPPSGSAPWAWRRTPPEGARKRRWGLCSRPSHAPLSHQSQLTTRRSVSCISGWSSGSCGLSKPWSWCFSLSKAKVLEKKKGATWEIQRMTCHSSPTTDGYFLLGPTGHLYLPRIQNLHRSLYCFQSV